MSPIAETVPSRLRPWRSFWRAAVLGLSLLSAVGPLFADDVPRTREQLEREIEERQEALDRLADEPAVEVPAEPAPIDPEMPAIRVEKTPESRRRDQEDVTVGGSRTVRSGEVAPGMVLIGGVYEVEKGAKVMGDVTVIGGKAKIAGEMKGGLVVVGGSVQLEPDAKVAGDVVSIGGPIREHGHAEIGGQKVQVAFGDLAGLGTVFGSGISAGPGNWGGDHWGDHGGFFDFSFFEVVYRFFRLGLLLLVVFAVILLAPGRAASVAALARAEPWRAGLIGLIAEVVFLPLLLLVTVVLLVSIIGIPLALVVPPLLVIALVAFFVVGYSGVALATGGIFERRFDRRYPTFGLALLGILLIEGWSLAGEMLFLLPGPIKFMAFLALAFGFFVQYVAWTVGLGAALGDQAERRRRARARLASEP